jgi:hypothetical protein
VWAAGNLTDLQAQVITAAAAGLTAGAAINLDLVNEEAGHAARRAQLSRSGGQSHRPGWQSRAGRRVMTFRRSAQWPG